MTRAPKPQSGAALVIALVMLAVILLLGTAGASLLTLDEHAARNHRAHQQAMLNAQAALDEACNEIAQGTRVTAQAFPAAGCGSDADTRGLCAASKAKPDWLAPQLTGAQPGAATYGEFSGRRIALQGVPAPRYLIELLDAGGKDGDALYRISAAGFAPGGARAGLQEVARRPLGAAQCRRLAWRPLPLQ